MALDADYLDCIDRYKNSCVAARTVLEMWWATQHRASETQITTGASQPATDRRETKTDEAQNVQNRWEHST